MRAASANCCSSVSPSRISRRAGISSSPASGSSSKKARGFQSSSASSSGGGAEIASGPAALAAISGVRQSPPASRKLARRRVTELSIAVILS